MAFRTVVSSAVLGVIIIPLLTVCPTYAQKSKPAVVQLSKESYHNGMVWAKLKPEFRGILGTGKPNGRVASFGATSIRPFVNKPQNSSAGRLGPRKPSIDISLYFSIGCDPSTDITEFIASLSATGYFEVVEPVYAVKPFQNPNDPNTAQQAYLDVIKAREAWDITQGTESMIIGIVDTGGDLDHPDLQDKIYINPNDPVDGIDNDDDGFIDDYRGWDFSGADLVLIGTPGFVGDNDPSVHQGGLFTHGTLVAGCAAATTNNGIGVASVGYKTKLLFTKHFADNQPADNSNYSSDLYAGILYVATHGAKIINCSWGSYNPSTIAQDIIKYVTLDLGCLIIAAAGNSNLETPIYPASYDYVLSIGASNDDDTRADFSNFGKTIDMMAPGVDVFTTAFDNGYTYESGTSLAAPIVSGAAALVWTVHPEFTPLQVAEQLRVSSDGSLNSLNPAYVNKLGHGRLNVLKALTTLSPSVRASNQKFVNDSNATPEAGQRTKLFFDFTNYLQASTSGLKATISTNSPYATIIVNTFSIGALGENATISNNSSPFEIQLLQSLPTDQPIDITITFSDGAYEDFQLISIAVPSYIDIKENNIITSLASNGRIGHGNTATQTNGSGFVYGEQSLLYEMGLMIGTSSSVVYDNVRGTGGEFNLDFTASGQLVKNTPGQRAYSEVSGALLNDDNPQDASLSISYKSLVWDDDPYRDFIILEYKIQNKTDAAISNLYAALFADWDIANNGANDRAAWNPDKRLGYIYAAQGGLLPLTGIQALTGTPLYYAIDNDQTIPGNPFGIYDAFTDAEKFTTMSGGVARAQAGNPTTGNDVSHVVGSGPYTIAAGQTVTLAFALHASFSSNGILTSAAYADSLYNYSFNAPRPIVSNVQTCSGNVATLSATGASKFKWYTESTGGSSVFEGPSLTTAALLKDTVLYVSNADHSYESIRVPVSVSVLPIPNIQTSGVISFCDGGKITLSTSVAEEYTWSNGLKTQSIEASTSGTYNVSVRHGTKACASTTPVIVTVYPTPSSSFTMNPEAPNSGEPVIFHATAADVTWVWNFGDGTSSDQRDPVHTFSQIGDYTVSLKVTSSDNCSGMSSKFLGTITGIEPFDVNTTVFPNPVRGEKISIQLPQVTTNVELALYDALGKRVAVQTLLNQSEGFLDVGFLNNGVYILRIVTPKYSVEQKVVIAR
ncbi:MAG: S8 family serine peptidase [Chryseolinea sp.]